MELEFWAKTDVGRVREHNEDNFLVDKKLNLFVVCDGMGGHAAGEVASAISVRAVREVISEHREVFDKLSQDPDDLGNRKAVLALIEHAIQEACLRVYQTAQDDESRHGMGTTCCLLVLFEGMGFIGHVGDSRVYLHRQNQVQQLTEDHSLLNEMIRLGKIQKGEEANFPHKNAVTRAVGVNEFVEVDTFELDIFRGDTFLLCSDGLSGYFDNDQQISDLLVLEDVKAIAETSIDFANAGGGKDNITSIVIRVAGAELRPQDLQRTIDVLRASSFFQYLTYKEIVRIVNMTKLEPFESGDKIMVKGSDPERMFLVLKGSVAIDDGDGFRAQATVGDHFGETAVVDSAPQRVTATALDAVDVLSVPRSSFIDTMRSNPDLAVKLLWNFVQTFVFQHRHVPLDILTGSEEFEAEPTPTPRSLSLTDTSDSKPSPDSTMETNVVEAVQEDRLLGRARKIPDSVAKLKESLAAKSISTSSLELNDSSVFDSVGSDAEIAGLHPWEMEDDEFRTTVEDALNQFESEALEEEPTVSNAASPAAVSGESVVAEAPAAAIIRKSSEHKALTKKDSTIEIDLNDENIEEIN